MSNDPNDFRCLTPGHFLFETSLTVHPEKHFTLFLTIDYLLINVFLKSDTNLDEADQLII